MTWLRDPSVDGLCRGLFESHKRSITKRNGMSSESPVKIMRYEMILESSKRKKILGLNNNEG